MGAFLAAGALRADFALAGATWARRGATRAFFLGFGFLLLAAAAKAPFSSGINVVICNFLLLAWCCGHDMDHSGPRKCNSNLHAWKVFFHLLVGRKRASMDLWLTSRRGKQL